MIYGVDRGKIHGCILNGVADTFGCKKGCTGKKPLSPINDTSPDVERILIDGYRAMTPQHKLQQVTALTQMAQRLALTRIRELYGITSEREERLRLASLWLPRETMIRIFGWDPEKKGY